MSATASNPEIGHSIEAAGIRTNYHDLGSGHPLLMIHGSGPGVSAWANWRLVMPELARQARVIAPDMVGFGFTDRPAGQRYDMDSWVRQAVGLLDALGIEKTDLSATLSVARWPWRWPSATRSACAAWC
jgi:2-hydroxymuconate-semialdehyde hydrolase